jgi:hypothetical protein
MTPTGSFAIVPQETDFDAEPARQVANALCTEETCPGSGGGGTPPEPIYSTPGVYMTYSNVNDLGEDWTRGNPEIEVFLLGK